MLAHISDGTCNELPSYFGTDIFYASHRHNDLYSKFSTKKINLFKWR